MPAATAARAVEGILPGRATADGDGVKIVRFFSPGSMPRLDPFLMLDLFGSEEREDWIGGFPDHPHRGFETVTYMIEGRMRHRDSAGNEGLLVSGGAQWMSAGSGLVHSETPEQENGRMEGFQLWLNLPARDKMRPPHYRDLAPGEIPEVEAEGTRVRVLAGEFAGTRGPISRDGTEPLFLDLHLPPGGHLEIPVPSTKHAFLVPYRGSLSVAGSALPLRTLAILGDGDSLQIDASTAEGGRAILVAGAPLKEPVAAYGPFVMNTMDEIREAFEDYRAGTFEAASVQKDASGH